VSSLAGARGQENKGLVQGLMENNDVGIVAPEPPVADVPPTLEPEARRRLVRFIIWGSIVFFGCAAAGIFFMPVFGILFFFFRYLQGRLDPVETLVVILAVEPWLGPYRLFGTGFDFDRGFFVLAVATFWSPNCPPSRRFLSNGLDLALLVFLFACLLSAAFCFMWHGPFRNLFISLYIPFGFYLVAKNCIRRLDLLPRLYVASVIAMLGFGILALVEGVTKVDIISYGEHEIDPFRVNGPMRMAEDFGFCISLLLLFFLGMRSLRRESPVPPFVSRALPLLGIVSCYLTLFRGIWITLGTGWLVLLAKRNFRLFLRVTPVAAIALWFFLTVILPAVSPDVFERRLTNEGTINARIATYKSAWAMFQDHPILGVGFSAFNEMWEREPERYHFEYKGAESVSSPHSTFMALLSETGLVGTLAFVFFLVQAFRCAWRVARHGNCAWQREYGIFMFSAIAAYVVAGVGLHIIRNIDFVNKYLFIFLGVLSGMIDELGQRPVISRMARSADFRNTRWKPSAVAAKVLSANADRRWRSQMIGSGTNKLQPVRCRRIG
jgi:O-antigen ligase